MAKIICITSGLNGVLNASLELVSRLEVAGHEVLCAAPKKIGSRFNFKKIPFVELPTIRTNSNANLPTFMGPFRKVARFFYKQGNKKNRKAKALETVAPTSFSNLLDRESPDFLIIDIELHEYIIKTYAQSIPFLILSQWFTL